MDCENVLQCISSQLKVGVDMGVAYISATSNTTLARSQPSNNLMMTVVGL